MNNNQNGINNINYKHGYKGTRLYNIWRGIKIRCLNIKSKAYKDYSGRGITICPEWTDKENGFINFRDWALSNGYQEGLEIDRIDNNGNYELSNCQWITHKDNCRKRRGQKINLKIANEIRILYNTGNFIQKELSDSYGISREHISDIINNRKWV